MSKRKDDFNEMFKPTVFAWLKKVVSSLLTPEGISYVFDLPKKISKQFFNEWKQKQKLKTK